MKRHCHYVTCNVDDLKEPAVTHKLSLVAYKTIGLSSNYVFFNSFF
jgi:hypothetical protein